MCNFIIRTEFTTLLLLVARIACFATAVHLLAKDDDNNIA
jgi:hypothetical protein